MRSAARWVGNVVGLATLVGGCGHEAEPPASHAALRLLPPIADGRALFPGDADLAAEGGLPLSSSEARRLVSLVEAAAEAGDVFAGVRLDVARGRLEQALSRIEEAQFRARSAGFDAERAAVLLESARRRSEAFDAVQALEAIPSEDDGVESGFNRRLAYCLLGLERLAGRERDRLARSGSRAVAALFDHSPSSCEEQGMPGQAPGLEPRSREEALARLERGDSQPLRRWIEEAIRSAQWPSAEAARVGEIEDAAVRLAEAATDDFAQFFVEELGKRVVSPAASAYRSFELWIAAEDELRNRQPERALEFAGRAITAAGSTAPLLRVRASLTATVATFQLQRYDEAIIAADALRRKAVMEGWNDLAGRAGWLEGLSRLQSGQLASAEVRFSEARREFEVGAQPGLAATVATLEADALSELGDLRASLRLRIKALPAQREAGLSDREAISLASGSVSLRQAGFPRAALAFLEESDLLLEGNDDALAIAEHRLWRASALVDVGETERGMETAEIGLAIASKIESPAFRERTVANLEAVRGRAAVGVNAASAERDLTRAIEAARSHQFHVQLSELLFHRARSRRALGDGDGALRDLEDAMLEANRSADELDALTDRALFFDRERRVADEAVSILAFDRRDAKQALEWALRLHFDAADATRRWNRADRCRNEADPFLVVVTLSETLARWWCHEGVLEFDYLAISRSDLRREVTRFQERVLAADEADEFKLQAEALFETILSPAREELQNGRPVGLILDGFLAGIPVAALRDASESVWLAERSELAEILNLERHDRTAKLTQSSSPIDALVVAAPALDESLSVLFPSLPEAHLEGEEVASIFPGSQLLTGDAASKGRVLESLNRFDLVHFAAHGMPRESDPGQAALVLAGANDDAFLTTREVARLRLDRPRLVVLSACESGRGYETSSLGALSLAGGFLAAGVPAVLGTLWPIDDAASREFMASFYRELSTGSDPASALRGARRSLMDSADPKLRRPANWAGYFLATSSGGVRGRRK